MTDAEASSPTLDQVLQQADACHQAGQLAEAVKLYQVVLQTQPQHPQANYQIGVLAVQMQQAAAALPYFVAALEADPARRPYWLSYIDALFQADQLAEARQMLDFARQQGLEGADVEALAVLLETPQRECDVQSAPPVTQQQPGTQQINVLVALFAEGRLNEAEVIARTMTEQFPQHVVGWKALGAVYERLGRAADALISMQKAVAVSPEDAEAQYNLAVILQGLGRLIEAEGGYTRSLQIDPHSAAAHCNLGILLQKQGRLADAEASYRSALQINPAYAKAHCSLGTIFQERGRLDEAEASYRQALQVNPDYAEALNNLGLTLRDLHRPLEAEANFRHALRIKADFVEALSNLGLTLRDLNRLTEAEACLRQAIQIKADYADAYSNLGILCQDRNQLTEAEANFRHALQLKPDCAKSYNNLGLVLHGLGKLAEAEASIRQALKIKPDYAEAHSNLGSVLNETGNLSEAEACLRRSLQINPGNAEVHSNLIFIMDMAIDSNTADLLQERRRWNAAHAAHLHQQRIFPNSADPERRLRIGYVSADFNTHSASYVFGAMLVHFDRSQFELIAYYNASKVDAVTRNFQQRVSEWRNIASLPDDAVADLIQQDRIDILVDLSGHSAGNRLPVFARKPAPLQITAWGYATSTGLTAMDVFFADPVIVPPAERQLYVEQVRYVPNSVGFYISHDNFAINALPALSGKGVTFGSFNRLLKTSDLAYRAWAQILKALPDSRMIFKTPALDDINARKRVTGYFTRAGIDPERIILQGRTTRELHMAAYNQLDIALDPFPLGGGVTAVEGLMMGVPLITLRWPTLAGRVSASIMTTMGLTDWIAESQQDYVELAILKANNLQSLAKLRLELRGLFDASVFGNQPSYVRATEQQYRQLWKEWCASRNYPKISNGQGASV